MRHWIKMCAMPKAHIHSQSGNNIFFSATGVVAEISSHIALQNEGKLQMFLLYGLNQLTLTSAMLDSKSNNSLYGGSDHRAPKQRICFCGRLFRYPRFSEYIVPMTTACDNDLRTNGYISGMLA